MNATRRLFSELRLFKGRRRVNYSVVPKNLSQEEHVIRSSLPGVVVPDTDFLDRLWRDSAAFRKLVAIECAETKKKYTYEQLWDLTARWATVLQRLDGGDTVAVMLPNCPEFPVLAFGALQAGRKVTTLNPIYKEFEITHQLKLTQPTVIMTNNDCYDTITKALALIKHTAKIVIVDKLAESIPAGAVRYSEVVENSKIDISTLQKVRTKADDTAFLPFSSGTTGLPKGVEISYKNLLATMEMVGHVKVSLPKLASESFQDVVPCILPFFHIYGLVVTLLGHMTKGCKLVTLPKFSVDLYLDVLKNQKATLLYVVPPIAILLGKHPLVGEEHLRHVRHMLSGAAPLSASDVTPLLEKTKGKLQFEQGFGATETTSVTTSTLIGETFDYSCAGVPLGSIELMFTDPITGKPVPPGESGELLVRGPNVMKGYYKNEEATRDTLTEDGFFKTGDLGYYKQGTGLYITDRIKELIKVKGMQVAPAELESLLRTHPAVQEAAVIGIPHEISGEVPKAFIITKTNAKTSQEELQSFVASKVAAFKRIEEVQFVNSIPKTASGKILRRELKKMYL